VSDEKLMVMREPTWRRIYLSEHTIKRMEVNFAIDQRLREEMRGGEASPKDQGQTFSSFKSFISRSSFDKVLPTSRLQSTKRSL
jgi:hypothetical protein